MIWLVVGIACFLMAMTNLVVAIDEFLHVYFSAAVFRDLNWLIEAKTLNKLDTMGFYTKNTFFHLIYSLLLGH